MAQSPLVATTPYELDPPAADVPPVERAILDGLAGTSPG
jgi:hypothetical protein